MTRNFPGKLYKYHTSWCHWFQFTKVHEFMIDIFKNMTYPNVQIIIVSGHHCSDVIMCMVASQITSLTIVYSTVYSDADQRKHQSSASLAFVRGIHRGPVNSTHKWPVTRKMFSFVDVIMNFAVLSTHNNLCEMGPWSLALLCHRQEWWRQCCEITTWCYFVEIWHIKG